MKLSLVVTVYNLEIDILSRCIESINSFIRNNDYFVEVIVIDDGSKIEFSKQYEKYLSKANICYVRKNNGGVSSARNLGLKMASGDYITFVDGDDYISDNTITMENFIKTDLLIFDMSLEEKGTKKIVPYKYMDKNAHSTDNLVNELLVSDNMNSACSKFFKMRILKENGVIFDESMNTAEDQAFVIDYVQKIQNIKYIDSVFYHYVRHVSSSEKRGFNDVEKSVKSLEKIRRKKNNLTSNEELIKITNSLYINKLFRGALLLEKKGVKKYKKFICEYAKSVGSEINFSAKVQKFILIGESSLILKMILCLKKVKDGVVYWRK